MEAPQRIIRAPKKHGYTVIDSRIANDKRLSWKARGILFYILTKPDNWIVQPTDLQNQGDLGRDAIYNVLKELELAGYMERVAERNQSGQIVDWSIVIHETPLHTDEFDLPVRKRKKNDDEPLPENPEVDTDNPDVVPEKQLPDKPDLVSPHISKYGVVPNTDSVVNTDSLRASAPRRAAQAHKTQSTRTKETTTPTAAGTSSPNSAPPPSSHRDLMNAYAAALGYAIPNGAIEGKAAKWLLDNHYSVDQVMACYRANKASDFYRNKHLSLQVVQKNIGAWLQAQEQGNGRVQPTQQQRPTRRAAKEYSSAPVSDWQRDFEERELERLGL